MSTAAVSSLGLTCREACHYATRRQRLSQIPQGHELLAEHPGSLATVTIAHPAWEVADNDLETISLKAGKQWLRRGLEKLDNSSLITIGSFEACLNVEPDDEDVDGAPAFCQAWLLEETDDECVETGRGISEGAW